jgi:polyvinyl alcohol dehydrogenase (cytochrome)
MGATWIGTVIGRFAPRRSGRNVVGTLAVCSALVPAAIVLAPTLAGAGRVNSAGFSRQVDGTAPWTMFGFNLAHSSMNAAAVSITPTNAASLKQAWQFKAPVPTKTGQPGAPYFDGSPVVADGLVILGSNTGVLYALHEDTGIVAWSVNTGFLPAHTCPAAGIRDTPTVAADPTTGAPTVYVTTAAGTLFAIRAATGTIAWKADVFKPAAASSPYIWDSPAVYGGRVYVGIATGCDNPLIRGGLVSLSQATGKVLGHFWTVGSGVVGGSIWSAVAADSTGLFVTTGNGNEAQPADQGLSNSVVLLNPTTMSVESHWTVPSIATVDDDFGSSPTLFTATIGGRSTAMVGACNKNGVYYAWKQADLSAGPVWKDQLGIPAGTVNEDTCIATAGWNGTNIFITTNGDTIAGHTYPAVSRELNPATGAVIWQTPLADGPVLGNTALDGKGVLAAVTYSPRSSKTTNELALFNISTGAELATYPTVTVTGGEPTFADGYLLFGGADGLLHALVPTAATGH